MDDPLHDRIAAQFSYRGERADVWRLFDSVLETDAFLNLGYSAWYQPHVVGSCQRRLVTEVGRRLAARLPETEGARLLDVGCGRGGPAIHLAERFGFDVAGVDLVRYNVARARENAAASGVDAAFVAGDATRLPVRPGSLAACVAIDALVYLPDRRAVFAEMGEALAPGGVVVLSDLVARPDLDTAERRAVARFAEAWDMPVPGNPSEYERGLADAGLDVRTAEDVSAHSVGRFRKWTTLFGWLHASPAGDRLEWLLKRRGLDAATIAEQVRRAHAALPALRHVLLVAEK